MFRCIFCIIILLIRHNCRHMLLQIMTISFKHYLTFFTLQYDVGLLVFCFIKCSHTPTHIFIYVGLRLFNEAVYFLFSLYSLFVTMLNTIKGSDD